MRIGLCLRAAGGKIRHWVMEERPKETMDALLEFL